MRRYLPITLVACFAVVVLGIGVGFWLNTPSSDATPTAPDTPPDTRPDLPPDTLPDALAAPLDLTPSPLPDPYAQRETHMEAAGLSIVQETTWREPATALLVDRAGQVRHRFNRHVMAVTAVGNDLLVLTDRDVMRLGVDGDLQWTAPFKHEEWIAGGGLVTLADGSVVGYLYGEISDSGVQLIRIDQDSGRKRWEADCPALGVWHSKYWHQAVAVTDDGRLKVTSRGAYGSFVEVLDARTGRSLGRKQDKGGE